MMLAAVGRYNLCGTDEWTKRVIELQPIWDERKDTNNVERTLMRVV